MTLSQHIHIIIVVALYYCICIVATIIMFVYQRLAKISIVSCHIYKSLSPSIECVIIISTEDFL